MRILFVCLGNICRSPTAEGVMRRLVAEAGLQDEIEIDSAGTGAYHVGSPPDERATAAALRRGTELAGAARQVADEDFETYDLLLAMDASNLHELRERAPDDEIRGLITALAVEPLHFFGEDIRRYSEAVLRRVEELDVTRHITQLKGKLQRMNPIEADGYSALLNELLALEQRRRQLVEGGGSA
jgi:protein-tyrosine-phosphatase